MARSTSAAKIAEPIRLRRRVAGATPHQRRNFPVARGGFGLQQGADCDCIQPVSDSPLNVPGALERHLPDPAATEALGHALAPWLRPGMVVTLDGPLGSGKTALVRAILAGLGHQGRVRSPTYTLVEEYELPWGPVRHFDFYRFAESADADDAGFREHFDGSALCLVEWPDRAASWLPPADLAVRWHPVPEGRQVSLTAPGLRLPADWQGERHE